MKRSAFWRRAAGLAAAFCLLAGGLAGVAAEDRTFADIDGHWARSDVQALAGLHYVAGMPDGLFHPNETMRLEQFVTIIVRSRYGDQAPTGAGWASGYLDLALQQGVLDSIDIAVGARPLKRGDAARIAALSLQRLYGEEAENDVSPADRLTDFPNCHTCRVHISDVYTKGVMTGRPGFIFDSEGLLTRAEGCAVIVRMLYPERRILPPPAEDGATDDAAETDAADALITPELVREIQQTDPAAVVVDVRNQDERDKGYIPGSILIPLAVLKETGAAQLTDKEAVVVVYCQSGGRSAQAKEFLEGLGYLRVYDMGGIGRWPYELTDNS
ncbi:MAG: S-layer homology domain-containing protein [Oscillospiraceae bacterium]|jgi:rhodanese-related sulfurtransferase|nr:S-layer homology domain-containing protein [Oscillospiraceae bacterium]